LTDVDLGQLDAAECALAVDRLDGRHELGCSESESRQITGEVGGRVAAAECVIAWRATSVPHATGTTQLVVYEANLHPGDRLQARLWHGVSDQVRADVSFQTRRVDDSISLDD
jgi:hypothetical protein